MSRSKAVWLSSTIAMAGGLLCALSFGPLADVTVFGMTIFNVFDYVTSNIALPLGGLVVSVFVGWIVDRHMVNIYGNRAVTRLMVFCLRWICPVAIVLIFLNSVGLI